MECFVGCATSYSGLWLPLPALFEIVRESVILSKAAPGELGTVSSGVVPHRSIDGRAKVRANHSRSQSPQSDRVRSTLERKHKNPLYLVRQWGTIILQKNLTRYWLNFRRDQVEKSLPSRPRPVYRSLATTKQTTWRSKNCMRNQPQARLRPSNKDDLKYRQLNQAVLTPRPRLRQIR